MKSPKTPSILYVATFPPRECGIATFTQDLTNAIDKEFNPGIKSKILAVNDNGTSIYNYPRKVCLQINDTDMVDYLNRANEINRLPHIKIVNIQHEYGIFGGDWGNYLLPFLELLKKPVITTFHTVLPKPKDIVRKITAAIGEKSAGIVVMTHAAARLLEKEYGVKKHKITVIPHGVHHVPFPLKSRAKKKLLLSGRFVLSTFGMLNRDKGIEYAIEALPEVVREYPNLLYLVIGATHPVVRRQEGEVYRNKLRRLVHKLKLNENVKFYNKYVELSELIDYLKATDIYISPTLNPQQAVSGTISYALSCACPIIATANQYAKDTITPERGALVRFKNARDIRDALLNMLKDKKKREELKKNAYYYSRHMTWQNVALAYFKQYNQYAKIVPHRKDTYPEINLDHIRTLTDRFGMIQFANHTKPDIHSGYCLDDNARALLTTAILCRRQSVKSVFRLIEIYFNYLKHSQKTNGKFYYFLNHNRFPIEGESEDSFGRAVWALGFIANNDKLPETNRAKAKSMLKKTFRYYPEMISLRAMSFIIIGLSYFPQGKNEPLSAADRKLAEDAAAAIKKLADKLLRRYHKQLERPDAKDWFWFEDCLTYSNYKLPEALLSAYRVTGQKEYLKIAESSLAFLAPISFGHDYFSPIGQDGWFFRNGKRSYFDQQPEDTSSAVEALASAYRITGKKNYADKAKIAFEWFLGKNHLNQMVYDEATGGSYDGLGKYSINFNQGAESTISYLMARLAIDEIK